MVCSCQSSRQILMITLIMQVSVLRLLMNSLGTRRLVSRFTCSLNSSHYYSEILAMSTALKHPCTLLKINLNQSSWQAIRCARGCQVCKRLPGVQQKYWVPPVQEIRSGYTFQWSVAHAGWGEGRREPRAQSLPIFLWFTLLFSLQRSCGVVLLYTRFVVLTSHLPQLYRAETRSGEALGGWPPVPHTWVWEGYSNWNNWLKAVRNGGEARLMVLNGCSWGFCLTTCGLMKRSWETDKG